MKADVSVIIPVLNGERYIKPLLDILWTQTVKPAEVLIVDSESEDNSAVTAAENGAKVISVKRKDFDHGKTRDLALRRSVGKYVLFLTQDAEVKDHALIEKLLSGFYDDKVAAVMGRQLPKSDASVRERLIRNFNYPAYSSVHSSENMKNLGIKAFFLSDVCAMYRKDIYLKVGGFDYPIKTNEDMFYAAKAIQAGYKIVYNANACVYHSHNFTLKQQYERNYIQGYEIEKHHALLDDVSANGEGKKLAVYVSKNLLREKRIGSFLYFAVDCVSRYIGNKNGHKAALRDEKDGKDHK